MLRCPYKKNNSPKQQRSTLWNFKILVLLIYQSRVLNLIYKQTSNLPQLSSFEYFSVHFQEPPNVWWEKNRLLNQFTNVTNKPFLLPRYTYSYINTGYGETEANDNCMVTHNRGIQNFTRVFFGHHSRIRKYFWGMFQKLRTLREKRKIRFR